MKLTGLLKGTVAAVCIVLLGLGGLGAVDLSAYRLTFDSPRWHTTYNNFVTAVQTEINAVLTSVSSLAALINNWAIEDNILTMVTAAPAYVDADTFTLSGDYTTRFPIGAVVQAQVAAGMVYSTVASSSYGAPTTTVNINDAVLTNPITRIYVVATRDGLWPNGPGYIVARDYGSDRAALEAADAIAAAAGKQLLVTTSYDIDQAVTLEAHVKVMPGAVLTRSGGNHLIINGLFEGADGCFVDSTTAHDWVVFGTGAVDYARVEWWGATAAGLQAALNSGAARIRLSTSFTSTTKAVLIPTTVKEIHADSVKITCNYEQAAVAPKFYEDSFLIDDNAGGHDRLLIRGLELEYTGTFNVVPNPYSGKVCGLAANGVNDLILDNVYFHGFNSCGVTVSPYNYDGVNGIQVSNRVRIINNSRLNDNRVGGFIFSRINDFLAGQGCIFNNNGGLTDGGLPDYTTGYGIASWSDVYGIKINAKIIGVSASENHLAGIDSHAGGDWIIANNELKKNHRSNISLGTVYCDLKAVISGNKIHDCSAPATYSATAVKIGDTTIQGGGVIGTWTALTAKGIYSLWYPTVANGYVYQAIVGGTTGAAEPTWPTTIGGTVVDGSVTWECMSPFKTDVTIIGNTISDLANQVGTAAHGVYIYENLLNARINIEGNVFSGFTQLTSFCTMENFATTGGAVDVTFHNNMCQADSIYRLVNLKASGLRNVKITDNRFQLTSQYLTGALSFDFGTTLVSGATFDFSNNYIRAQNAITTVLYRHASYEVANFRMLNNWYETGGIVTKLRDWNGAYYETRGTAAPASEYWTVGSRSKNTAPAEAGSGGSKYVIDGWVCTVAGTPGTWLQQRCLTGN